MLAENWQVWTSAAELLVDSSREADLAAASAAVRGVLAETNAAINTFEPTSELATINAAGGGTYMLSATLAQVLAQAITAYERTGGAFDPRVQALGGTAGQALTFQLVTGEDGSLSVASTEPASLHEQVQLTGRQLTLAEGVQLNLIGIGKAWAVDRGADAAAQACGAPVLLNIGGDIATAGPTRPWTVTVQDLENDPASTIELINGGAIATSSTQKRRWARDGQGWHHIINPATGLSATPDLATASVIAGSATEANTYSTAAIVWGSGAHQKLAPTGLPTRLVTVTGTELTHHWPATPTPQP
ncbi:FAD:protein FMN transferase [Rothia nasimurium]|uniref:FAD:protein FMN transferase n=1 Tax=Rothia nasimurium TaxID=85336 RepID=UPI0016256643|nr:FAD:protein FMN transferase [Rothia nasimurium]